MAETLSPKTSKALGITDPLKELTSKAEEAGRKELEASSAIEKLEIDKAVSEAERTREKAKTTLAGTEEATKRLIETQTPLKEQKSEVDKALMDKNFEPSKENLQDKAALFSLINVIGFAIGTGGKQNSMMAMHAMNGMLEGHQKGRADLFKQEQVKFEKNFKALQQKATFLESELRHSLEDFTRDKRAADERAAVAFAESGANFMKQYAEKYGLVEAHKRAVEVKKSADKAVADYERDQRRNQEKIEAEGRHLEQMKELKQFGASLKGDGVPKETAQEKREAKMGTAGPQRTIYEQTGKMLPDAKTARDVQAASQGIRAIEGLQEDLRKPEVKTGLIAKASPLLEKISSLGKSDFETAVNTQLTGTDETTLFLKKALLTSYAIERAAAGGGRLTVEMMKRAGPVLDPTNYTPQTYNQLLDDRRKDLYETLHDNGFDSKDVKKMTSREAYIPYGGEVVAPKSSDKKAMPTGEKLKAYTAAHPEFKGSEDEAKKFLRSQGYE